MIFPISTRSPTRNSAKTARSEKLSKMNGLPSASDQNGFEFANSQIKALIRFYPQPMLFPAGDNFPHFISLTASIT
jgi:hypothetical protein